VGSVGRSSQLLDNTRVEATGAVETVSQNPTNGGNGNASADRVAANLRRLEFLRPECLLPVSAVAERLGVSAATVHEAINAGKLRFILFGSMRRVRPEDLDAYVQSQSASRPPADEDWYTVVDLMHATGVSRSQAYRLLERGTVPFQVFAGTRYIRSKDLGAFLRTKKTTPGSRKA
jgi:excisionase family DNA binding protein